MLHQTFLFLGQVWQLFEVSQILEFLRYYEFYIKLLRKMADKRANILRMVIFNEFYQVLLFQLMAIYTLQKGQMTDNSISTCTLQKGQMTDNSISTCTMLKFSIHCVVKLLLYPPPSTP